MDWKHNCKLSSNGIDVIMTIDMPRYIVIYTIGETVELMQVPFQMYARMTGKGFNLDWNNECQK